MAGKRFDQGVQELLDNVGGGGKLTGSVVVDQIYAKFQHESLDLKHPSGGKAMFLRDPNANQSVRTLEAMARVALRPDGLKDAMVQHVEATSRGVYETAPLEFGDLRASGHPSVKDGGRVVYDRPAAMHRLSKSERRAKARVRDLGFGN